MISRALGTDGVCWQCRVAFVPEHLVPAAPVTEGERGEIAEHVLADRVVRGVGDVVGLAAVDVAGAVGGLAVQVVHPVVFLLARFGVRARRQLHVDRGARDHVLVVAGRQRQVVADLLAHQHRGALDADVAAVVHVPEHVGAILRQHPAERRRANHQQRQQRARERTEDPLGFRAHRAGRARPLLRAVASAAAADGAGRPVRPFTALEHVLEVAARDRVATEGHDRVGKVLALVGLDPGSGRRAARERRDQQQRQRCPRELHPYLHARLPRGSVPRITRGSACGCCRDTRSRRRACNPGAACAACRCGR